MSLISSSTPLKGRERDISIDLPRPRGMRRGDKIRISARTIRRPAGDLSACRPRDRVAVLLTMLGSADHRTRGDGDRARVQLDVGEEWSRVGHGLSEQGRIGWYSNTTAARKSPDLASAQECLLGCR